MLAVACLVLSLVSPAAADTISHAGALRSLSPPGGGIWHGVCPGGRSGEEDDITLADVRAYERAVGHRVAWVCFSNNWYRSPAFPRSTARWIRDHGATPYIRLMLRSDPEHDHPEPRFALNRIADGAFERELMQWMRDAARFGTPLIVEFGTDVHNPREPADVWATSAFRLMLSGRWPQLVGFSWWNETWQNDDTAAHDTDMRVQSDPALAAVFRQYLSDPRVLP